MHGSVLGQTAGFLKHFITELTLHCFLERRLGVRMCGLHVSDQPRSVLERSGAGAMLTHKAALIMVMIYSIKYTHIMLISVIYN